MIGLKYLHILNIYITMTESRSVPHLRKGIYYTLTNCANRLALSMPKTNKYTKDKLEFQ